MIIEQIYTGCLAQGAYYIESDGEAVVIDPLREIKPYIEKAKRRNARIKYVFETHFHADFVSGHIDLARETGATIVYGPTANPGFDAHIAQDGEVIHLGKVSFRVLHTPGHTMESSCYLLNDEHGKEVALFTGDTLFIGDVGRPDLAQKVASDLTQEKLAGYLYDSLHTKIMTLSDDVIVYPAHGAGSACGKNMSKETSDRLGNQKATNYALRKDLTKEDFIQEVLTGLTEPPKYFPLNVLMNIKGYENIETVLKRGTQSLSPEAFEAAANETGALVLDTRDAEQFSNGFIPNSINIGINGNFAPWVGALIPDIQQEILLITDEGKEEEVVTRLARVGYDRSIGFLKGGFAAWAQAGKEVDRIQRISADQLAEMFDEDPGITVIDVRKKSEYDSERMTIAENIPLDHINDGLIPTGKGKTAYVHCAGGYRSMIFISILKARGFDHLIDVRGGFKAIKESGKFRLTDYVCPTTLL
jgi:glyoxylase-like metal-dependent hydrolase (beta-lactamase superfamily II)/rhodanese-related sulfurtransferase